MREGDPVEERIAVLERRQAALEARMDEFAKALSQNNETTNAIKADTEKIVALFKASMMGATIIKWLAGVGSAIIVGVAAFKGLSH